MRIFDTLLFSLTAVLVIIGVHQSILHGVQNSYFIFMFASGLFLWYSLRKRNRAAEKADSKILKEIKHTKKKSHKK
jgi:hypothetical protein